MIEVSGRGFGRDTLYNEGPPNLTFLTANPYENRINTDSLFYR